ncbi:MAG: metallophosphoesterase [Vicinamibacterales bacterium]
MVGWFDPGPLISTALDVVVSTMFGRHSDYRLLEALATSHQEDDFDYTRDENGEPRPDIWVDYVADTGDGWNSTYSVAYWITRPSLVAIDENGRQVSTRPGRLLVFGGDQVYPSATRRDYQERLVRPFETARNYSPPPEPDVFAVPGNHDWYDSLVSFTRLFCSQRWFQGWRTRQRRSYFALRLPGHWWLIGTDFQLGSDIDALQVEYFKRVAAGMQPGDRIILCCAEPHWVFVEAYQTLDPEVNDNNLRYLERVFARSGARTWVHLAGDLHHYRRHAHDDGTQKITAGGGGAFLHPTHGTRVATLPGGFALKAAYPPEAASRRLAWRNLLFPIINPKFGWVTASIYAMVGWWWQIGGLGRVFGPLLIVVGFVLFTDTHSKWYRRVAGTLHGVSHLFGAWALAAAGSALGVSLAAHWPLFGTPWLQTLVGGITLFGGGWVAGSFIMGLYLLISLNVFGRHSNEAFSALRIDDFKHFVRLHIGGNGELRIFPMKIERVARAWRPVHGASATEAQLEPDDPRATAPASIERAILVPPPPSAAADREDLGTSRA